MAGYDAFISYSHAADGQMAPAIQEGLQRLAKPWNRRRALEVFRDQTGLSVTPHLWGSITAALDTAQWFVLLASPESANSEWVGKEISHWLGLPPIDGVARGQRLLPVVTGGVWQWDEGSASFTAESTAVNPALHGVYSEEPLYLDLSWAKHDSHLDLRVPQFKTAIANLSASIQGTTPDELLGEDVRQFKLARRLRRGAVIGLATLTVAAIVASVVAVQQRGQAVSQKAEAVTQRNKAVDAQALAEKNQKTAEANAAQARSRELAALALNTMADDPGVAALLAVEANYPNGSTTPIDVPEARAAVGITLRASLGAAAYRVGPRIAASVTDILRITGTAIATYDATKGTDDGSGNLVPPDWWDATTGARIASPVTAAENARLLFRYGHYYAASDVLQPVVVGEHPVTWPLAVDDASGLVVGREASGPDSGATPPTDLLVQPLAGGPVTATLSVPAGVDLARLVVLQSGTVVGLGSTGGVYAWSLAQGGAAWVVYPVGSARSIGVFDRDKLLIEFSTRDQSVDPSTGVLFPSSPPSIGLVELIWPDQLLVITELLDPVATVSGSFATSPDQSFIAAISQGDGFTQDVVVWNVATGRLAATIAGSSPTDLHWADDDTLAIASSRGLEEYRMRTSSEILAVATDDLAMSKDGSAVASWQRAGDAALVYRGRITPASVAEHGTRTGATTFDTQAHGFVSLDPAGRYVAASWHDGDSGAIRVTDAATGVAVATFPDAMSARFSPDGSRLAVATADGLAVVDTHDWSTVRTYKVGDDSAGLYIGRAVWSPDGSTVLAGVGQFSGPDLTYSIDLASGAATPVLDTGITEYAWSADGSVLATGYAGGVVRLWASDQVTRTGASPSVTFVAGGSTVTALAFSPDGERLVAGGQSDTTVFDVRDPLAPRRLQVISDLPMWRFRRAYSAAGVTAEAQADNSFGAVAFRPDGKSIVLAGASGILELPDDDPAAACTAASAADLAAVAKVLGAPSACLRVAALRRG